MRNRLPGRDAALACAAVAAAVLALLSPALLRGEGLLPVGSLWRVPPWNAVLPPAPGNPLLSDQLLYFWPWRLFLRGELLAGRLPLWNPLILGGVPFAGCVQAAPFYPTTWLLPLLSPPAWSVASAFLKLAAAGVFTALHVRRLGAGAAGMALSGVCFALCGFLVAWLGHPHANAACLLPALFWALGRSWVPAAVVVGLILLGGHPPTALHVLAAGAAYALFLGRPRAAGAAFLAGAALAAPALLPYLEYLPWSSTAEASAALARWGTRLPPSALATLLMPLGAGSPAHGGEVLAAGFGFGPEANFLERAGWVGLPALALAALAASRGGAERRFHAGLALAGLAGAFGLFPLPWAWRVLPGFSSVNPTRLLLLFAFGASVLAGLGAEDREPAPAAARRAVLAVLAAALPLAAAAYGRLWAELSAAERGFAAGQAAAYLAEAAAALWLLARPGARRWAALPAGLFLLRAGLGLNPTAPSALLYPRTPGVDALAQAQGEGRVLGLGAALAPDVGMALGLRDARGRDFAAPRRYEEAVTGRAGDFDFLQREPPLPPSPLLAVSAIAASPRAAAGAPPGWTPAYAGELLVFLAPRPVSRALFVPEARWTPRALDAVRAPGFDPARAVLIDDWEEVPPGTPGARGAARIAAETSDAVAVDVEAGAPGWLLLLDNWHPGWRAERDGVLVPVRRADHAFRAVAVPAGRSRVTFRYVPYSFYWGLFLAALAAAALGWAGLKAVGPTTARR